MSSSYIALKGEDCVSKTAFAGKRPYICANGSNGCWYRM